MKNDNGSRVRGIYLLPNLFTSAGLFAGFYAVISALNDKFEVAAIAILLAAVLDGLDGRIARITKTESSFGAEYDSLADVCSFGMAPALVVFEWSLNNFDKLGFFAGFLYMATVALRLARFNTQLGVANKRYFQGLPSPAAAAAVVSVVWLGVEFDMNGHDLSWLALFVTIAASLLMVSKLRYFSFKKPPLSQKTTFMVALAAVIFIALISINPAIALFCVSMIYLLSGPILTLYQLNQTRRSRKNESSTK